MSTPAAQPDQVALSSEERFMLEAFVSFGAKTFSDLDKPRLARIVASLGSQRLTFTVAVQNVSAMSSCGIPVKGPEAHALTLEVDPTTPDFHAWRQKISRAPVDGSDVYSILRRGKLGQRRGYLSGKIAYARSVVLVGAMPDGGRAPAGLALRLRELPDVIRSASIGR